MSCIKIDPSLHQARKPEWIKVRLPSNPVFWSTKEVVADLRLHTVCEEAQCPNRWECWSQGTATFMIAGERCTRACGFCAVATAKPFPLETDEPQRVAEAVGRMKLKHVVITAVARDDLKDGGAGHFAQTIRAIRAVDSRVVIEVLTPDFNGRVDSIQAVLDAEPEIFNHNLETVERLTPVVRSRATYRLSLEVLARARQLSPVTVTKSGIMLGLGETGARVVPGAGRSAGGRGPGVDARAVPEANAPASPGGELHFPRPIRHLPAYRTWEGVRARISRPVGAQFVSRGRLSSGGDEMTRADRTNVAALIPAYFKEAHIEGVARRTLAQLDHVLVLDDGSTDRTAEEARKAGAEVIRHEKNQGKGAAIKTGLRELDTRGFLYVLVLDGDGQHLPEEIPGFIEEANRSGAPFVVGARMFDAGKMPVVRRMTNRFMSARISALCGQPVPDSQCGFRMMRREVIPHLYCESNNYDYETEMLLIASREGFRITSVPVSTVYGEEKSKIHPVRDTIRFFKLLSRYKGLPKAARQG